MKTGIVFSIIGAILTLISVAYLGWALFLIPMSEGKAGDWYFISQVALHGLIPLIPGIVLLYFGTKKISRRKTKSGIGYT